MYKRQHVVGGMFGGDVKLYDELTNDFEEQLLTLLNTEDELYHEELILSCMAVNTPNKFTLQKFDDWYAREEWKNDNINPILFYHLFL